MEPSPAECRRRAIEALRPDFLGALLAGLAATSPGLIAQVVSARFGRSFFMLLQDLSAMSTAPVSPREMLLAWFQSGGAVTLAAGFVSWVLSPALMLGLQGFLLGRLRGEIGQVSDVFSRLGWWLRALGLQALVLLKVLLWAMPGYALLVGAAELAMVQMMNGQGLSFLMIALMYAGMLALALLVIPASYRYSLSAWFMVDGEKRIRACVAHSKRVMKNRKMELFMAELVCWSMLLLVNVLSELFGAVLGAALAMLAGLVIQVYQYAIRGAFYERYGAVPEPMPVQEESESGSPA